MINFLKGKVKKEQKGEQEENNYWSVISSFNLSVS